MTTIAVRDNEVAFDSRVSVGGTISPGVHPKAWRGKRHPVIYAGCGTVSVIHEQIRMLEAMDRLPWDGGDDKDLLNLADDATVIVVVPGLIYWFEGITWYPFKGPFYAFGSGRAPALAAMHMGADAREAVRIACKVDRDSAPPVRVFKL